MNLPNKEKGIPRLTLAAARKNAGLTQVEAAKRLGVSSFALYCWEKGTSFPTQPKIDKICSLYNIPYDCINFSPND